MKNNLKKILPFNFLFLLGMFACTSESRNHETHQQAYDQMISVRLTAEGVDASGPYLTYDHERNPVLCWTEALPEGKGHVLRYAVFNAATEAFGETVTVIPSSVTRAHPESMNKVAFKADGTVVAIFSLKHATKENPFAGSILYTLSTDEGKNWADAEFIHSDTLPDYGRGYFDLAPLPNGEVGAVWIDGRNSGGLGSAIFFASTTKGEGFGADQQIGESTCECCRTDIYVDRNGRIHVAYRDITFPVVQMGKQVRDMSYTYSDDLGKSFTKPIGLSADNWSIEGCPHTGPSLASNEQGLQVVWFTEGGGTGVYYTSSADHGSSFAPRQKISGDARFPQMATLPSEEIVMVWNESKSTGKQGQEAEASPPHHGAKAGTSFSSQIQLQLRNKNNVSSTFQLTAADGHASHPVVIPVEERKILIAWTRVDTAGSFIEYQAVDLDRIE